MFASFYQTLPKKFSLFTLSDVFLSAITSFAREFAASADA
jgi:hypothetical protein